SDTSDASGRSGPGPLSPALRAALTDLRLPGLRPDGVPDVWLADRRIPGDTAREVRLALATALYERWHAGTALEPDAPARLPRRDHAFEARLIAATPHSHTPVEAVVHTTATRGGGLLTVELGRVRVSLPPEAVRGPARVAHEADPSAVASPAVVTSAAEAAGPEVPGETTAPVAG
ncbi:hypothetical protein AB4212_70065, partial [Streptomyces sp. 2MCAF27]